MKMIKKKVKNKYKSKVLKTIKKNNKLKVVLIQKFKILLD